MYSVAALVLITLLAFALPGRVVAGLAAVLAAVGLLITFYIALAIIASACSGTPPVDVSGEPLPTGFATAVRWRCWRSAWSGSTSSRRAP